MRVRACVHSLTHSLSHTRRHARTHKHTHTHTRTHTFISVHASVPLTYTHKHTHLPLLTLSLPSLSFSPTTPLSLLRPCQNWHCGAGSGSANWASTVTKGWRPLDTTHTHTTHTHTWQTAAMPLSRVVVVQLGRALRTWGREVGRWGGRRGQDWAGWGGLERGREWRLGGGR